jgi:hypothetical protein
MILRPPLRRGGCIFTTVKARRAPPTRSLAQLGRRQPPELAGGAPAPLAADCQPLAPAVGGGAGAAELVGWWLLRNWFRTGTGHASPELVPDWLASSGGDVIATSGWPPGHQRPPAVGPQAPQGRLRHLVADCDQQSASVARQPLAVGGAPAPSAVSAAPSRFFSHPPDLVYDRPAPLAADCHQRSATVARCWHHRCWHHSSARSTDAGTPAQPASSVEHLSSTHATWLRQHL